MRLVSGSVRAALLLVIGCVYVQAQTGYPERPIRLVVPFPPGASNDVVARAVGERLGEALGQPVVVDNRGGAGTTIGTEIVARSPADGYTLMVTSTSYTTNAAVRSKLPFDPVADITGVSMIGKSPMLLVVHPAVPAKSFRELLAFAKARPGQVNYASAGSGTIPHLITEALSREVGIAMVHVPYKGLGPAINDLVGGHVQLLIASPPSVLPQVKANRLRALAVSSEKRSALMSELPTIAESGVPGFAAEQWWGVFAPAGTPKTIVARLNKEIRGILASEKMQQQLAAQGAEAVPMSAADFSAFVGNEIARWRKVVKEIGIKPD